MKYKPSRDIPQAVRELKDISPSKIALWVLNKRNEERTPESVTMWFRDHSEIFDELSKELVQGLPTEKQATDATMFQNGNFEELASVKDWILFMRTRRRKGKPLHPKYIVQQIRMLSWICKKFEKHPDRLNFRDAQEIFLALETEGRDTCHMRKVLKDFLKSKGSPDWEKIGVGKPSGFGKYRTLFVEKRIVMDILEFVKGRDFRVFTVDSIMYRNGLRLSAVRTAKIEDFKRGDEWDFIKVLEKFRETKDFMLPKDVGNLIAQVIGERKDGLIFEGLTERDINIINREALKKFVPELEPKIEMPSHFFRHMFFQHLLRATDWNSDMVSAIGQCTVQSLKESYGGAPEGDVKKWCVKYLPMLGVQEVKA